MSSRDNAAIGSNTPLHTKIRQRTTSRNISSASSRLRQSYVDSQDDDDDPLAVGASELDDENMQQRQFTRMHEGTELDELENGQHKQPHTPALLNQSGNNNNKNKLNLGNGNGHARGYSNGGISEKERYKARQDDPVSAKADHSIGGVIKADDEEAVESTGLTDKDKRAMVLLVALYLLQGIPVGLAFGSIPYLLRSKLSYSQIGIFTLCTYPYSLKLLWSPIVDSIFSPKLGRRKSWIVPIQTIVGLMLWWLSRNINEYIDKEIPDVKALTILFFILVFFAATQDIAVDGWALTLLSKGNLSYASTAQTIGLNCGYFLSFTVFLAFNSLEFSNKYFRSQPLDYPLVTLPGYLKFGAIAYIAVTGYLAFFQPEEAVHGDDPDMDLKRVYTIMYRICRLKHLQHFALVHLVSKLGTATNDAATSLKLLEKGLSKEDLALAVLIDFPFQIIFGWLAARWSAGDKPLQPWIRAMWLRLLFAFSAMFLIHYFPSSGDGANDEKAGGGRNIPTYYFLLVISSTVLASFASTVQFVGISAFHTIIADPAVGGTYMTLVNTLSNLGGTWPRFFVLRGIDTLTKATCYIPSPDGGGPDEGIRISAHECVSDHGKAACADLGGQCRTERDGYYATSAICLALGVILLITFVQPTARKLQALPNAAWRVKLDRQ